MKPVFSAPKLNNKHIKASSPPKFGIRPNNSKVMFMKSELDTKEILNEKIKQAQLKEILDFQVNMKNHNNFGNNHDISKSPPYTNSNHMKYHNSFNQNHNISNSPFYVNTKSLHDNTKGKALNDQNYFTRLEEENNVLKEEIERKSDLINIMLNAWNINNNSSPHLSNTSEKNPQVSSPFKNPNLDEKIKKARIFSKILRDEKYETPHNKIKNAEYILNNSSNLEKPLPYSIDNTPQLPAISSKRILKSSSPTKIKQMNRYKAENNDKKSIFFPKIKPNNAVLNEFLDDKTAYFPNDISIMRKAKALEKIEEKVFSKFPQDFFPHLE